MFLAELWAHVVKTSEELQRDSAQILISQNRGIWIAAVTGALLLADGHGIFKCEPYITFIWIDI